MNKKKIVSLCLIVCLLATAVVGGTLAYFTDTDAAENVFTTGLVDIVLKENFTQNSELFPGKQNAVQKEVWIELDADSEDAYVWYTYAIPAALDSTDGSTGTNNIIHVNAYGKTWDQYWEGDYTTPSDGYIPNSINETWDHDPNVELAELVGPQGYIGSYTGVDGIEYNVYLVLYHGKLSNDSAVGVNRTTIGMSQVYMDAGVDTAKDADGSVIEGRYTDKNGNLIAYDFNNDITLPVKAYAIQAEGFSDVYEAYRANPVVIG